MNKIVALLLIVLVGCVPLPEKQEKKNVDLSKYEFAVFAGGCFWCVEKAFEKAPGVVEVISGYSGGDVSNPTYQQVSSQTTGHFEAIKVYYDPAKITYKELVDVLWRNTNPTDAGGQFVDRGSSYKTAIFYKSEQEKQIAEQSKAEAQQHFDKPIVTPILPFKEFFPAEEYHQDYYKKHPIKYQYYFDRSGRPDYFEETWSDEMPKDMPSKEELKQKLTPLQYKVTQEGGTERPFENEYWANEREGIYVDLISGEPLFSSKDKFKSGTGWPSFTQPIKKENVMLKEDNSLFQKRTEVKGAMSDAHLGHVFDDGPQPTGQRWCMNSAAMKFIPKEDLEKEGYGEYLKLFE